MELWPGGSGPVHLAAWSAPLLMAIPPVGTIMGTWKGAASGRASHGDHGIGVAAGEHGGGDVVAEHPSLRRVRQPGGRCCVERWSRSGRLEW